MTLGLAFRNLLRHRGRTLMTLLAIGAGVAALIVTGGFVLDLYRQLGESIIHSQSGHLQLARSAYFAEGSRSPEKQLITQVTETKSELARIPHVKDVMARLSFSGLLNNARSDYPVIGEGVEPHAEAALSTSIELVAGRMLKDSDRMGMLVGEGLAKTLQLRPGDTVTLLGNTIDGALNTAELEVTGVFRSFSRDYDARAVKISLSAAQDLLAVNGANVIVLLLDDTDRTREVRTAAWAVAQAHGLAVKDWQQLNDFYANTVALYDRQFDVLKIIILFLVALGVSNAVNMAILERMGEFGTMRALGNRGSQIAWLVMVESAMLGGVGALAGMTCGSGLALLISAIGIPMPPPPNSNIGYLAEIELSTRVSIEAMGIGMISTVVAAAIPAWRARRVPIVDALRTSV